MRNLGETYIDFGVAVQGYENMKDMIKEIKSQTLTDAILIRDQLYKNQR